MKRNLFLFGLLLITARITGQDAAIQKTRVEIDSFIGVLAHQNDPDKIIQIIIDLYKTKVESYPLLVIELGQKLSAVAQQTHQPVIEAVSWGFFGQGYRLTGNYIKGLECHHKALVLAEKSGNYTLLAITQNQLAHIYKDREENEKALRLYASARENAIKGHIPETVIWPMMNMGAILLAMNQPDSSLYYSGKAYDRCLQLQVTRNQPYILMNIAGAYSKKGDNAQAMAYYAKALAANETSQSVRFMSFICQGLAEHYLRNDQPDSSAYYARKAIQVAQNSAFAYLNMKPAKLLTDIYENNNADSTLKYLKIYRAANDSLFSNRANQQLQMMTFEEDQRQRELAEARMNYQNKIKTNILLGVLTTIVLITLILWRNNKQKHKANLTLAQQKEELANTLSQLKATQTQLVHAEKMASLGELTAGIAHEIQNPLNFINNFAEVNQELADELESALAKGNEALARDAAVNIKENESKIVYHGKRADAIVKSMLMHSRNSTGQKELTDINALVDEYVRLAYHGMRARDKSFNVEFKTELDPGLPKINVVPQDIGRVLLNLINNAFQALSAEASAKAAALSAEASAKAAALSAEASAKAAALSADDTAKADRSKDAGSTEGSTGNRHGGQSPVVLISTKYMVPPSGSMGKDSAWAVIAITDNGPGIPETIKEKIFQPFFTTKPTGQGTGLGLSLSFDIVKAHGGKLLLETKEGEGATFIIHLPIA